LSVVFSYFTIPKYSVFLVIGQPIGVGPSGPPSPPTTPVSEEHLYTVTVYTGSVKGAGTTSNVYLTIFGKKGSTNEVHLKKGGKPLFTKSQ
jgi:hypothetical protein